MRQVRSQESRLPGIAALARRYDVFLLDQFGVLHDGAAPYPGAVDCLARLKDEGKRIALISNSGKRSGPNEERLVRLGFAPGSWDHFVSSGEVAWRRLAQMLAGGALSSGARCLLISRDGDRSAVDGLTLRLVPEGSEADVVLLAASEGDRYEIGHYRKLLEPAARRGVPCYCTNPDKIMLTATGRQFGAGRIAELYQELGGKVFWIGKPFAEIYRAALALCGNPQPENVVCVGDSVEHDIAGGQASGLATALVATGILADAGDAELTALFERHDARPDYLLPAFTW
ncbi:TIGR01459 family HAD-type hydrolase [Manganibacter manganicus]|uniref:HAD family hydrolase n=1 Tax=Manganibacter manganicus TaxID=1873176 RepID=A0A1V8RKS2_9HYPH|nr:TIGR01459 family HAD-type hydrolase [Pseudaminobacter manganicus]OQM73716.1 HAD family hydrolase [Pseudaminobacter manganicus]